MGRERAKAILIHLTSHLAQIKPWVQLNRQKTQVTFSWATACSAFFFWSSSCCSLLLFSPSSFISLARSWRSLFSSADCLRRNIFTAFLTRSTGCINSDSNINTKPYLCSQRAGLGGGFFPPPHCFILRKGRGSGTLSHQHSSYSPSQKQRVCNKP